MLQPIEEQILMTGFGKSDQSESHVVKEITLSVHQESS